MDKQQYLTYIAENIHKIKTSIQRIFKLSPELAEDITQTAALEEIARMANNTEHPPARPKEFFWHHVRAVKSRLVKREKRWSRRHTSLEFAYTQQVVPDIVDVVIAKEEIDHAIDGVGKERVSFLVTGNNNSNATRQQKHYYRKKIRRGYSNAIHA